MQFFAWWTYCQIWTSGNSAGVRAKELDWMSLKTSYSLLQCTLWFSFLQAICNLPTFLQISVWIPFLSVILHLSSVFLLPKVSSQQWMIQYKLQFQSWFLHVQVQPQESDCNFRLNASTYITATRWEQWHEN